MRSEGAAAADEVPAALGISGPPAATVLPREMFVDTLAVLAVLQMHIVIQKCLSRTRGV